jgi:hypothetical protein
MSDGNKFTAMDQEEKDRARAQQRQQQQRQQKGISGAAPSRPITAEDLCVVNSFNWNTICEVCVLCTIMPVCLCVLMREGVCVCVCVCVFMRESVCVHA